MYFYTFFRTVYKMNKYRRTRLVNILRYKKASIILQKNTLKISRTEEIENSPLFKNIKICSVIFSRDYIRIYIIKII